MRLGHRSCWTFNLYPDAGEGGGCFVPTLRPVWVPGGGADPERSRQEAGRRARGKLRRSLVEDARELRERLAAASGSAGAWAMSLTGAELRLLPYLATHLTVPEIATRLFISRNTVKTEAVSIYRKLGASSRSQAIERAVEVGLLEHGFFSPSVNLTQEV